MNTNYDLFAKTFSTSRENMKWEEIEYFLEKYCDQINSKKILDIWCGNWRLLDNIIKNSYITDIDYFWIDSSKEMILEAKNKFWTNDFFVVDMLDLNQLKNKDFESIFFIASFHHLLNIKQRIKVLEDLKNIIKSGNYIFMTNWSLNSDINKEKYKNSIIKNSQNEFRSIDYNIKIWEFERFYHSFSLSELEYLFTQTWYEIIENRLFDNGKNYVSVIRN